VSFSSGVSSNRRVLPLPAAVCGERAGERGERRRVMGGADAARECHLVTARQPMLGAPRRSPLSPALSPEYRGEGGCCSNFARCDG